jgi:acyl-CoA reductase-like NAD-dependent aldehyde dehydrogenase
MYDRLFIGGNFVEPETRDTAVIVSPYSEEPVATVALGSRADIDRAVGAARQSFDLGVWRCTPINERIDILRRLSKLFTRERDRIADVVTSEMGCPISVSEVLQATSPRMVLDAYVTIGEQFQFSDVRRSPTGHALVLREPVGVVAAIVPWNAPIYVAVLKLAPALLAGCSVVLKPSPETPLDSYILAELLQEVGVPKGVVNVVTADKDVSEYLVTHPGVDKVSFTGSTAAGRRIAALCGGDLRRVTLELGGKSAALVLDDADFGAVAPSLVGASFRNAGQSCAAKTRILVPRRRMREMATISLRSPKNSWSATRTTDALRSGLWSASLRESGSRTTSSSGELGVLGW